MKRNFGAAASDYATHRAGFPDSLFVRLAAYGIGTRGEAVIDVGTGTGSLARGFARRGCRVLGVDPDERLLDEAAKLDAAAGVSVEYRTGVAEAIPASDGSADVVTAGQAWHWFDGPAAAREFGRVTRPGGKVVIAHFDWLAMPGNMVEATERLIVQHNPNWKLGGGNGFHVESLPFLRAAGYAHFETFSYDLDVAYTPVAWRGRIRASAGIGASLDLTQVDAFDAELAAALAKDFPADVLHVPHRVFALVGARV